ncbi:MAG TPA: nuclear transport factor 2 family protein [Solirubrobacterales bacterium]|nr:nuclear transport factor 2 family protein [Solirubrobacterales bacterium]
MASREQRVALAQGGMEAFNEGDMPRMLAALSEDVEVYASPEMANAGQYSGHDGFVSWITRWTDAWEEISAEVTDNSPVGERHVVTTVHQEGRGRGGIEVSMELAFLFDVDDDGLCSYLAMLPTPEEAREIALRRETKP